jgi:hypothetical protein
MHGGADLLDHADASDDLKFCYVFHVFSPSGAAARCTAFTNSRKGDPEPPAARPEVELQR